MTLLDQRPHGADGPGEHLHGAVQGGTGGGRRSAVELICSKRDGGTLAPDEITRLLEAYLTGAVSDEQMAAMLMAVVWRGLDDNELGAWMDQMVASGVRLDLSGLSRPTVDKHSTGGVGDKISLVLAPLVAACGAGVPQLSGRGLGHTGGTLDKLEAIPGWRANLSTAEFLRQLDDVGAVICAAGADLAPADAKLYALRDVTGTVESIPLISASIMSKKVAEGTESLLLDVKVGRGAFMQQLAPARMLAATMVRLGAQRGVRTVACLTRMDAPLGRAVGNSLEVLESVAILQGGGPASVRDITLHLARQMVALAGLDVDPADRLADGSAYAVYREMIKAQGGDPDAELVIGAARRTITAPHGGVVQLIDAKSVGVAACRLGAGRLRKEDTVSFGAGVEVLVQEGDDVEAGQPLFEAYADDERHLDDGSLLLSGAFSLGDRTSEGGRCGDWHRDAGSLIIETIGPEDVQAIFDGSGT